MFIFYYFIIVNIIVLIANADVNFKIKLKIGNSQCIYEYFPNLSIGKSNFIKSYYKYYK